MHSKPTLVPRPQTEGGVMEASEQKTSRSDDPVRIGIVGGGPAGLVAALALARC
jgi:NADPH-dependent 2,4-dienoyl-CoA reductase/sulfur reductase-like enzyme